MRRLLCVALLSAVWVISTGCPASDFQGHLSGLNIEEFKGCSKVEGNLIINQTSLMGDSSSVPPVSGVSLEQLSFLSDIHEITGFLSIKNLNSTNITNLRFLRSLEVLGGDELLVYRTTQEYSLVIEDNEFLVTLGLSSLRKIKNGGVRVSGSPQLCLVDTLIFVDFLMASDLVRTGGLGTDCTAFACHEQCSMGKGCWGTLADECVECRNFQFMDTCLQSCDLNVSYLNESTLQCVPLPTTSPLTTTAAIVTPATQTTSEVHNGSTSHDPPTKTDSNETENTSTSATNLPNAHSFWPLYILAGIVFLLLIFLLNTICVISYYFRKRGRKMSLRKASSARAVSPGKVSNHHPRVETTLSDSYSRNRRQTHEPTGSYNHTQMNTAMMSRELTAPADISAPNMNLQSQYNGSKADHWYHSQSSPTPGAKLTKGSPTVSKTSVSQQSGGIDGSEGPRSNFRHSQNSLLPHTIPSGVYSTRTPPSHPHRFSQYTSTPHTHRGSTSSFQGGRNSRTNSMPSCSRSSNSWSSSSRVEARVPVHNSDNSLSENNEFIQ